METPTMGKVLVTAEIGNPDHGGDWGMDAF
jgi:hypothetical protein